MQRNTLTIRIAAAIGIKYAVSSSAVTASVLWISFFFFKQKTAYEIRLSLVGSEMCIRDRTTRVS